MKKWIKFGFTFVAALNLVLLGLAFYPQIISKESSSLAYASGSGSGPTLHATPIDNNEEIELTIPDSCKNWKRCHGFWNCFKKVIKCAHDLLF